jgi:hypothetical protein
VNDRQAEAPAGLEDARNFAHGRPASRRYLEAT